MIGQPRSTFRVTSAGARSESLAQLQCDLRKFAKVREWEQFHSPKNLAAALIVEAAELLEHFQWLTDAESRKLPSTKRRIVAEEIADVLLYLVMLSDQLDIDVVGAARAKLAQNAKKYPIRKSKGSSKKYTEL